ncbi:DUF2092 domain-containing protein [Aestuariivirga sp.]|uniref:DUF2092 domain-containing protein n=1 Tax=Aestuariivirga sp. TaxID=2650926 RepID=UPI0035942024
MAGAIGLAMFVPAQAEEPNSARELFKAMADNLVSQQAIFFTYDSNLEIVTAELQKVGFAASGSLTLARPDKLRVTRTGGYSDVELAFDGKTVGLLGKGLNVYTKVPLEGSVDELIDALRLEYGIEAPAADLLSSNPFDMMMSNVTDAKDLGTGVISGQQCDHLAFRTRDTDWELWISQGEKPRPCKFTITSKMTALAPSYSVTVTSWKDGADVASDDFQLKTGDAKQVEIGDLPALDEIPTLAEEGDAQ